MNILQTIKRNRELKNFRKTVESGDTVSVKVNGVFHSGIVRIANNNELSVYVSGFGYRNYKLSEIYPPL